MSNVRSQFDFISPQLEVILPAQVPEGQSPCPICYSPFTGERDNETDICQDPRRLPCGHIFGHGCIFTALNTSPLCPLCRTEYPTRKTIDFILEVANALFEDCHRSGPPAEVGFTQQEQFARLVLLCALAPVFITVIVTMDVGQRSESANPMRKTTVPDKLWCWFAMLIAAPVTYLIFGYHLFSAYLSTGEARNAIPGWIFPRGGGGDTEIFFEDGTEMLISSLDTLGEMLDMMGEAFDEFRESLEESDPEHESVGEAEVESEDEPGDESEDETEETQPILRRRNSAPN